MIFKYSKQMGVEVPAPQQASVIGRALCLPIKANRNQTYHNYMYT